jgi:hypothetical protein
MSKFSPEAGQGREGVEVLKTYESIALTDVVKLHPRRAASLGGQINGHLPCAQA